MKFSLPLNNVPLLSFSKWLGHWMCTRVVMMLMLMIMRMIMMDVVGCWWVVGGRGDLLIRSIISQGGDWELWLHNGGPQVCVERRENLGENVSGRFPATVHRLGSQVTSLFQINKHRVHLLTRKDTFWTWVQERWKVYRGTCLYIYQSCVNQCENPTLEIFANELSY